MNHLVVGASGQVGRALSKELTNRGEHVSGTYWSRPHPNLLKLDMCDGQRVKQVMSTVEPDVVWIPGAMPDVDRCEREPEVSYRVNVEGPDTVCAQAREYGIPVVFFSTDYVFDGEHGPFRESDAPHPLQVYGAHKVEAERALLSYDNTLIIRPAWIYSDERNPRNFAYRVVSELKDGRVVKAASDQYNTPTPAGPLVRRTIEALSAGRRGILHLTGPERMTRLELVRRIAALAGYQTERLEPVELGALTLPARRPLNGGLISDFPEFAISERIEDTDFTRLVR